MRLARTVAIPRSNSTSKIARLRHFSSTRACHADFTHVVIGAGVVGLAVACQLVQRPGTSTILVERNEAFGMETSSRNSEVIHAGIYYGASSLKAATCIRGKELLYKLCKKHQVPYCQTGKWIVAQNESEFASLERIHAMCKELEVPVSWVSQETVTRDGEGVKADAGVLESPTTGIVDSHGLMLCLQGLFEEAGGLTALNTTVNAITPLGQFGSGGWELEVADKTTGEPSTISAETIVNCAGLGAVDIHNMIVPRDQHRKLFFAKGNYFSYSSSKPKISRLIYPAPAAGASGLGTHLTLDLAGRIRFGPDLEWVEHPDDLGANSAQLPLAIQDIKRYLPSIDETCMDADYAGIRPKLMRGGGGVAGKGFLDFIIQREGGYEGWVNLLGIESPGLTASLAIGERVDELLYK